MTTDRREAFAAEVRSVILQMYPDATVTPVRGEFGFMVHRKGDRGVEQQLTLDNVFHETRGLDVGAMRRAIVSMVRTLAILDEPIGNWEQVRPRLMPLLRPSGLDFGSGKTVGAICRPFAPYLIECVGVDSEGGILYVNPGMLRIWGVTTEDVFAAAHQTASRLFVDAHVSLFDKEAPFPIWFVRHSDSYESSRLLMPGWLASFEGRVTGRPIAVVPSRELLVVGGDGDERCLRTLIALAQTEYQSSMRSVSTAVYTTTSKGGVVPLVLPETHPFAHAVALGHIHLAMAEYGRQKQNLVETREEDIFVASLQAMRRPDGNVFSFAQWSYGVSTLLPRANRVVLMRMDESAKLTVDDILCVPWADFLGIVGECIVRDPALDPPRWRTKSWPDESKMARLRMAAVPLGIENAASSELH